MPAPSRVLAAALTATLTAGCAAGGGHASPATAAISVSVSSCGAGWHDSTAGAHHLVLHNTDSRPGSVQLVGAHDALFADVDPLAAGTSTAVDVRLGAGSYFLRCLMEDETAVDGPKVTLSGSTHGVARGVRPVTQADLVRPTQAYERYVVGRLGPLARHVRALREEVRRGDRQQARRTWLAAHLAYERLGAAYEAFGDLDATVNGTPYGLPGGVNDPHWTGFHRVERGLWHGEGRASLLRGVDALTVGVSRLRGSLARTRVDPLTMAIRAHEISENALQLELTGTDDFGSRSSLRTVAANLAGTATVLHLLRPLLSSRLSDLPGLERSLRLARGRVAATRGAPLSRLSHAARAGVDAALGDLCERLASVASILEPRRTS